jgi:hypothetical protein
MCGLLRRPRFRKNSSKLANRLVKLWSSNPYEGLRLVAMVVRPNPASAGASRRTPNHGKPFG